MGERSRRRVHSEECENEECENIMTLIVVDCEAEGPCPSMGLLTEFGAVAVPSLATFHGRIWECEPDPANPAVSKSTGVLLNDPSDVFSAFDAWLGKLCIGTRPLFVSDNVAFDFMWIADGFWNTLGRCPFGHSGRCISDFYAGLRGDFGKRQEWKRLRVTRHDHNPVHDALGNAEALLRIFAGER
jgi:hypothetical protein